jgi:hypothetical protein
LRSGFAGRRDLAAFLLPLDASRREQGTPEMQERRLA